MSKPDKAKLLEDLADDIEATAEELMTFAKGLTGYEADQCFAPCVQIKGAFSVLAKKLRARTITGDGE
jgi:hypothetical protein